MSPQRRTALVSVLAACALIALKLGTAIATNSLGLLSEAAHSGTDLIAALLTFYAVGVAIRPADPGHAYGHGKAEHLAALAEAGILVAASLVIAWRALWRLTRPGPRPLKPKGDAFFVLRGVLMDRVPREAEEAALRAIAALEPAVELRRLRMRQAAGQQFADVVIGVSPGAAVGQGHAAADAVEAAVQGALPESDVVVHVEPRVDHAALRERALAAAQRVPRVREIHNLTVLRVGPRTEVSLHLKLPGELPLEEAHGVANDVERAIAESVPEVDAVQTHLEPLAETGEGRVDVASAERA